MNTLAILKLPVGVKRFQEHKNKGGGKEHVDGNNNKSTDTNLSNIIVE